MKIEEKVKKYFKANKAVGKIFSTTDGFLFTRLQHAQKHGSTLTNKKVTTHTAKNEKVAEKVAPRFLDKSVEEIVAALPKIEDVKILEAYKLEESNTKNARKTAIEALKERIAELNKTKQ